MVCFCSSCLSSISCASRVFLLFALNEVVEALITCMHSNKVQDKTWPTRTCPRRNSRRFAGTRYVGSLLRINSGPLNVADFHCIAEEDAGGAAKICSRVNYMNYSKSKARDMACNYLLFRLPSNNYLRMWVRRENAYPACSTVLLLTLTPFIRATTSTARAHHSSDSRQPSPQEELIRRDNIHPTYRSYQLPN